LFAWSHVEVSASAPDLDLHSPPLPSTPNERAGLQRVRIAPLIETAADAEQRSRLA
jgi:hypothetical protein